MNRPLPVIAAFIPTEAEGTWLRRRLQLQSLTRLPAALLYLGEPKEPYDAPYRLLLVQTGMGPAAARQAAQYVFSHFSPLEAWGFGCAGATREGLKTGEALVAEEAGMEEEEVWLKTDEALLKRAERLLDAQKTPYQKGRLITVDRLIGLPAEKMELGRTTQSLGVAMEGFSIGQEARAKGIPFLEIRWILDPVDFSLPDLKDFVGKAGETKVGRGLWSLLKRPGEVGDLFSLLPGLQKTRRAMAEFLSGWLKSFKDHPPRLPT